LLLEGSLKISRDYFEKFEGVNSMFEVSFKSRMEDSVKKIAMRDHKDESTKRDSVTFDQKSST